MGQVLSREFGERFLAFIGSAPRAARIDRIGSGAIFQGKYAQRYYFVLADLHESVSGEGYTPGLVEMADEVARIGGRADQVRDGQQVYSIAISTVKALNKNLPITSLGSSTSAPPDPKEDPSGARKALHKGRTRFGHARRGRPPGSKNTKPPLDHTSDAVDETVEEPHLPDVPSPGIEPESCPRPWDGPLLPSQEPPLGTPGSGHPSQEPPPIAHTAPSVAHYAPPNANAAPTATVVPIRPAPQIVPAAPVAETVEIFRELLRMAESGEIIATAGTIVYRDQATAYFTAQGQHPVLNDLVAGLAVSSSHLVDRLRRTET